MTSSWLIAFLLIALYTALITLGKRGNRGEIKLYHALIQPYFDYCCSVWDGLGENLSMKVQKLQKWTVRVITSSSYDTMSASFLLDSLQLDKLSLRRKKLKTNLMFKILNGHTPSYLQSLFSLRGTRYNFRNSEV
jgi:hypothetical protein